MGWSCSRWSTMDANCASSVGRCGLPDCGSNGIDWPGRYRCGDVCCRVQTCSFRALVHVIITGSLGRYDIHVRSQSYALAAAMATCTQGGSQSSSTFSLCEASANDGGARGEQVAVSAAPSFSCFLASFHRPVPHLALEQVRSLIRDGRWDQPI